MGPAAGSRASWAALVGLGALVAGQACTGDADTGGQDLDVFGLLAAVGPDVMLPALERFQVDLIGLEVALVAWQDGSGDQAAAQDAWKLALASWQPLELMQLGPAGDSLDVIAGQSIRDLVYSWPTINGCRVDQETTEQAWDDDHWFDDNLVNAYGLDALEHLLFASLENSCSTQIGIDEAWAALGDSGVLANRQAYALTLASHAAEVAEYLHTRWSSDGGDFSGLLTAVTETSPYDSQTEALNAVFDALFYLDNSTKDRKLGQPLGLLDCSDDRCPEDVEGLISGTGVAALAGNLDGFEALFTGGDGAGFDDLLAELGHGDLSDDILDAVAVARATVATLEGPLDELVSNDPDAVTQAHADIKAITDLVKGDLATILALRVPDEAAGDND